MSVCARVRRFVVAREYGAVFTTVEGEELGYALPTASLPRLLPDFTGC